MIEWKISLEKGICFLKESNGNSNTKNASKKGTIYNLPLSLNQSSPILTVNSFCSLLTYFLFLEWSFLLFFMEKN